MGGSLIQKDQYPYKKRQNYKHTEDRPCEDSKEEVVFSQEASPDTKTSTLILLRLSHWVCSILPWKPKHTNTILFVPLTVLLVLITWNMCVCTGMCMCTRWAHAHTHYFCMCLCSTCAHTHAYTHTYFTFHIMISYFIPWIIMHYYHSVAQTVPFVAHRETWIGWLLKSLVFPSSSTGINHFSREPWFLLLMNCVQKC